MSKEYSHKNNPPGRYGQEVFSSLKFLTKKDKKSTTHFCAVLFRPGGDYRDRTGDLLHAMQALSQLS